MDGPYGINWTQVIVLLISVTSSAYLALRSIRQNHQLTLEREAQAHKRQKELQQHTAEEQLRRERHFICTELIFILEGFAVECADVVIEKGTPKEKSVSGRQEILIPCREIPQISFVNVTGDWRVLNEWDMFRTMEIPVMLKDAHVRILNCTHNLLYGMDSQAIFQIRGESVAPSGLRAASVARKLRRQCGFPTSPLSEGDFSATRTLQKVRKRYIKTEIQSRRDADTDLL